MTQNYGIMWPIGEQMYFSSVLSVCFQKQTLFLMKSVISHTDKHLSKRNYDNLKKNGVINVVLWVFYFNRENVVFFVCAAQPLAYSHASCTREAVAP